MLLMGFFGLGSFVFSMLEWFVFLVDEKWEFDGKNEVFDLVMM